MTTLQIFSKLKRSSADALTAFAVLFVSFYLWIYFLSRVSFIDYDSNDIIILGSYFFIFFIAIVIAPLLRVAGNAGPVHYIQALTSPLKWEFKLRQKNRWFLRELELREIIYKDGEAFVEHNLSLIYRNLICSLPAYALHSVSTVVYFGDQAIQVSILTAAIISALSLDTVRRARRIYVILSGQIALFHQRGPRVGSLQRGEPWSPLRGAEMASQISEERRLEFAGPEFDILLDEETKRTLAKIKARSKEDVLEGLIKTGILTEDGELTHKYGGRAK